MDCYKVIYPKLDFSRILFYVGTPPGVGAPGFTMSSGGPSPDIRIYVQTYDCTEETFLTIGHELVHALQIQGMTGGGHIPGSWASYYMSHYIGCVGHGSGCSNDLEKEAYVFANGPVPSEGCQEVGQLRNFIDTQLRGKLPCDCSGAWPVATTVGAQSYVDAWKAASGPTKSESAVGRTWCSLLWFPVLFLAGGYSIFGFTNTGGAIGSGIGAVAGGIIGGILGSVLGPWGAVLGALLGAYLGSIVGGAIGAAIDGLLSGPSARIWFTAFDGKTWVIPDIPISKQGHTRTSASPTAAMDNSLSALYLAYKSASNNDLWYNVFDGASWLTDDIKISKHGHTQTDAAPTLAVYNGVLYLAYKSASNNDLWYNVFDGASWLTDDIKISKHGHTQTDAAPTLAVYNGLLYLAYKSASNNDLWYNVFDGTSWLTDDIKISQGGHVHSSAGPSLATVGQYLFMIYRDDS
ncbi:hypothetical protein BST13_34390 [Mycobacterium aquaticum]|uniref:Uncharacterized protein n=2 Tax=Mycobacterium aquaticum TaxID=1927124 RepID=A0A1X0A2B6_9MYCO|nr:hypothetical protein BST13_34390 [Mycobacterium aquaticum]